MWELTVVSAQDEAHREVEREEGVSCARDGCARRYLLTKDEICSCSMLGVEGGRMEKTWKTATAGADSTASGATIDWLLKSDEGR